MKTYIFCIDNIMLNSHFTSPSAFTQNTDTSLAALTTFLCVGRLLTKPSSHVHREHLCALCS